MGPVDESVDNVAWWASTSIDRQLSRKFQTNASNECIMPVPQPQNTWYGETIPSVRDISSLDNFVFEPSTINELSTVPMNGLTSPPYRENTFRKLKEKLRRVHSKVALRQGRICEA